MLLLEVDEYIKQITIFDGRVYHQFLHPNPSNQVTNSRLSLVEFKVAIFLMMEFRKWAQCDRVETAGFLGIIG